MAKQTKKVDLVDEIAAKAAEKVKENIEERSGGLPSSDTQTMLDSDEAEALAQSQSSDIFSHCKQYCEKTQDHVMYYIHRDGGLLGRRDHPYSWETLQKEFGGGYYKIQARSMKSGSYIKQETQLVHPPADHQPEFHFSDSENTEKEAVKPKEPSFLDTLAIMRQMQMDQMQQSRDSSEKMMATITGLVGAVAPFIAPLFQKKDNDTQTTMLLEFIKETNRSQNDRVMQLVDEIKRLHEKPVGPTPFELMKQLREENEQGYKRAMEMMDLIDEKAAAKASELSDNDKEESVSELLIKNLLPVMGQIGQAVAANSGVRQPTATSPARQAVAVRPPQGNPGVRPPQGNPGVRPPQGNPGVRSPQGNPGVRPTQGNPVVSQPQGNPAVRPQQENPNVAQVKTPQSAVSTMKVSGPSVSFKKEEVKGNIEESKQIKESDPAVDLKKKIVDKLVPKIGSDLKKMMFGQMVEPRISAKESLELLELNGVPKVLVAQTFTKDDLMSIVKSYGLPEKVIPWFNEYYANIISQTSLDDRTNTGSIEQNSLSGSQG